jgi:hypothetical protein
LFSSAHRQLFVSHLHDQKVCFLPPNEPSQQIAKTNNRIHFSGPSDLKMKTAQVLALFLAVATSTILAQERLYIGNFKTVRFQFRAQCGLQPPAHSEELSVSKPCSFPPAERVDPG